MTTKINLAVVGATSIKGELFLTSLAEANLDIGKVYLLADEAGAGEHVDFGRKESLVTLASDFDFTQVQHVILIGSQTLSQEVYPAIEEAGCAVIDASGFLGNRDDVSLATVQEEQAVAKIVSIPETATLVLWFALQPILQETAVSLLDLTILQCAVHGDKPALEDLGQQTAKLLNFSDVQPSFFAQQIAFNLIPQVGELTASGETTAEVVIVDQIARLCVMPRSNIEVSMLWAPVFYGDVVNVSLLIQDSVSVESIISDWEANPLLVYSTNQVQTPVANTSGKNTINLSRLRMTTMADDSVRISFCVMADPVHLHAAVTLQVLKNQLLG